MMSNKKQTLLIVESPAKCKKIEEYLGKGYMCVATYGHLRTIQSLKDVDVQDNFKTNYTITDEPFKKKQLHVLKKSIQNADEILLASDADREGEMIAYSIIVLFHLPLTTKRIAFHEITKHALQNAVLHPRTVDLDLVYAQQTRQILDLFIGYKISPILWDYIQQPKGKHKSLSAGRCQTPALKLIYENQMEIEHLREHLVYNIHGYFTNMNLLFVLNTEIDVEEKQQVVDFLTQSVQFEHIFDCSSPVPFTKSPPQPFTTSRLQQTASNVFSYSPKETMQICQTLYESGYITYMRTDSNTYSETFLSKVNDYIFKTYGDSYIRSDCLECSSSKQAKKNKFSQEAHEAIRPTDISLKMLPDKMNVKQKKMYSLIWKNTLESCLPAASGVSIVAKITAPMNCYYSHTSEIIHFPGWKIVEETTQTTRSDNKTYFYLQTMKKDSILNYSKIYAKVASKETKLHYSEAKLVQLLEQKGIGRPSTFSSIVDKIQERGYVKKQDVKGKEVNCCEFNLECDNNKIHEYVVQKQFGKEKNKLIIQPLGITVIQFLNQHFASLFDYNYTSIMEENLDGISKGEIIWQDVCRNCNNDLETQIQQLKCSV